MRLDCWWEWDGEVATLGVVDTRASGGVDIWDVGNVIGIRGYSCVPFTDGTDTSVFKVGLLVHDVLECQSPRGA